MSGTITCESCGGTFDKGRSDAEAAAEAEELFPGIDVSDPAEAGACMRDGEVLKPGNMPVRGVYTYDGPLGFPPDTFVVYDWTAFRDRIPHVGRCYQLASWAMVHVRPGCRCRR